MLKHTGSLLHLQTHSSNIRLVKKDRTACRLAIITILHLTFSVMFIKIFLQLCCFKGSKEIASLISVLCFRYKQLAQLHQFLVYRSLLRANHHLPSLPTQTSILNYNVNTRLLSPLILLVLIPSSLIPPSIPLKISNPHPVNLRQRGRTVSSSSVEIFSTPTINL